MAKGDFVIGKFPLIDSNIPLLQSLYGVYKIVVNTISWACFNTFQVFVGRSRVLTWQFVRQGIEQSKLMLT